MLIRNENAVSQIAAVSAGGVSASFSVFGVRCTLRIMKFCISVVMVALLCSCAHDSTPTTPPSGGILVPKGFVAGHGDVGRFILEKTTGPVGKKAPVARETPLISAQWSYTRFYHSHDVEITLPAEKYADVKLFLDKYFGPPDFDSDRKDSLHIYRATKPDGGAIHLELSNREGHEVTDVVIYP